ncbi:hypothetical protein P5V15_009382 [Pogonomyrmex californicus]
MSNDIIVIVLNCAKINLSAFFAVERLFSVKRICGSSIRMWSNTIRQSMSFILISPRRNALIFARSRRSQSHFEVRSSRAIVLDDSESFRINREKQTSRTSAVHMRMHAGTGGWNFKSDVLGCSLM